MAPTASPTTHPSTIPWSTLTILFLTLFTLTLLLSIPTILTLRSKAKRLQSAHLDLELELSSHHLSPTGAPSPNPNPHPFGTEAWRTHCNSQAPRSETDALTMASLQAQIRMLEDAGDILDNCLRIMVRRNGELSVEIADLRGELKAGGAKDDS